MPQLNIQRAKAPKRMYRLIRTGRRQIQGVGDVWGAWLLEIVVFTEKLKG
jgi:hypothetical protein